MKNRLVPLIVSAFCAAVLWPSHVPACYLECPLGDNVITDPDDPGTRTPDSVTSGVVDLADLAAFAASYGGVFDDCQDMNCDGVMSLADFAIFASHYTHAGGLPTVCSPA